MIIKSQVFNPLITGPGLLPVDRTVDSCRSRSTGLVTNVHGRSCQLGLVVRSTGRSTVQRALLSRNGPGRPAGRLAESSALCIQFRSTGWSTGQRALALWFQARSTGGTTVIKMTVGRSTGRSTRRANLPFPAANGQNFCGVINTHFFGLF